MDFPFKLNTSEEVAVTLGGKEMRFVANYPHAFHSEEDLNMCAEQARDGRYDGLSLLPDSPSVCYGLSSTMDNRDDGGPDENAFVVAPEPAKTDVLLPRKPAGFFHRLREKFTK